MADENQNPGRKWRELENDGDGNRHFDSYRYTPYTTDLDFFRDPNIYETDVARTTQHEGVEPGSPDQDKPRGARRSDELIKAEIETLLREHGQVDAGDIRVDVRDGIVTLSGSVSSSSEMEAAAGITNNVIGTMEVKNQLTIKR